METTELTTTSIPLHLTIDPVWDLITVLAFGTVADGIGRDRYVGIEAQHLAYVLDEAGAEVIGFVVRDASEFVELDPECEELWDGHRFHVPALALVDATVGEVLLAIRGRYEEGEPTADALHFHTAINTSDPAEALPHWLLALEAGCVEAHYGLGYTLIALGDPRAAYGHLRYYAELTPDNPWSFCWLGQAAEGAGMLAEARAAYERAVELEDEEDDTGAAERLAAL